MRARRWLLVIFGVVALPLAVQQPGAAPPAQELPPPPPASQPEPQSPSQDTLEKKQNAAGA
jgi:hypothetical protein